LAETESSSGRALVKAGDQEKIKQRPLDSDGTGDGRKIDTQEFSEGVRVSVIVIRWSMIDVMRVGWRWGLVCCRAAVRRWLFRGKRVPAMMEQVLRGPKGRGETKVRSYVVKTV
jgi:hypothetical protein